MRGGKIFSVDRVSDRELTPEVIRDMATIGLTVQKATQTDLYQWRRLITNVAESHKYKSRFVEAGIEPERVRKVSKYELPE
jgi:hypothetical protein